VSGEVSKPGVYQMPPGSRVADLISLAGGVTERADPAMPSRALLLRDEMHVHVPVVAATAPNEAAVPPLPTAVATLPPSTVAATPPAPAGQAAAVPTVVPSVAVDPAVPAATLVPVATPVPAATARAATSPGTPAGLINLNTASAAELEQLPGIGTALAARIIADRQRNGPFRNIDDLERVPGIGPAILARVRPLVGV
jgi:competence protein ComEA